MDAYQVVHGFAGQKLPNARTEHLAAVSSPGVGRQPSALELHLPALTAGVDHLAQRDGCAVPQLPCKVAELVTAVVVRGGVAAGKEAVAGKVVYKRG